MKWVLTQITREDISGLNVWLANNTDWQPISVQKVDERGVEGWSLVARRLEDDTGAEWAFLSQSTGSPGHGAN